MTTRFNMRCLGCAVRGLFKKDGRADIFCRFNSKKSARGNIFLVIYLDGEHGDPQEHHDLLKEKQFVQNAKKMIEDMPELRKRYSQENLDVEGALSLYRESGFTVIELGLFRLNALLHSKNS